MLSFKKRRLIVQVIYALEMKYNLTHNIIDFNDDIYLEDLSDTVKNTISIIRRNNKSNIKDIASINDENITQEVGIDTPSLIANSDDNSKNKDLLSIIINLMKMLEDIDDHILDHLSSNWRWDRMAKVVQAILRAAVFEIIYYPTLELGIIIQDYLEISKSFDHYDELGFINSVLDKIAKEIG